MPRRSSSLTSSSSMWSSSSSASALDILVQYVQLLIHSAPSFTIAFAIFDSNGIFSNRLRINHNHSMPPSPIIYDDSIRLRSNHLQSLHFELARAPDNPRTFLNALLVVQLDIRLFFFVVENNNNGIISIIPWCANQRAGAIPPVTSRRSGDWGSIHTSIQAYIYI